MSEKIFVNSNFSTENNKLLLYFKYVIYMEKSVRDLWNSLINERTISVKIMKITSLI